MSRCYSRLLFTFSLLLVVPPGVIAAPVVTPASALRLSSLGQAAQVDSRLLREDALTRTLVRQAEAGGRTVTTDTSASELVVAPANGTQVQATAELVFWSNRQWLIDRVRQEFDLRLTETGRTIDVAVEMPSYKLVGGRNEVHYELKLTLQVPTGTPLEIGNRYGNVSVRDIAGPARIRCTSGDIEISGGRGLVDLQGRYGAVKAVAIDGDLQAETTSGTLQARSITGSATLRNSYGDIEVHEIEGPLDAGATSGGVTASSLHDRAEITASYANVVVHQVTGPLQVRVSSGEIEARDLEQGGDLSASYGKVVAERVTGNLQVTSTSGGARISDVTGRLVLRGSYDDASVRQVGGGAEVRVESGGVTAHDIGADLTVSCSYGTVRAGKVVGDLQVTASSTAVHAEQIDGAADITTSYAGVTIDGVGGRVVVRNQSGAVTIGGLTGEALSAEHRVETSYGDIEFTWSDEAGLTFQLESTYGQVTSDLPGSLSERGSRKTLQGTAGSGPAQATLIAKNGSVTLHRR